MTSPASTPAPTHTVRVALGDKAYDVLIGHGILSGLAALLAERRLTAPSVLVHDENLRAWAHQLRDTFHDVSLFEIAAGEEYKSMLQYIRVVRELAQWRIPRSGALVALGGGVIGDLAGFAAATYLRGINFVQIPTTLLAMVDSSVGGKTGVNLKEGKNLVGAFHQPRLVVADLDTLATLPPREFAAGMAEVIKYGVIADRALFNRVADGVDPSDAGLADIVARCVEIKVRIVEQDEFETTGLRAVLNFGHTIGHAIEKATDYKRYLHGEAISLGMRAAAWLSVRHAGLPEADARRIESALRINNLPLQLDPAVKPEDILAALGHDKKVTVDGQNRWVLLDELGKAASGKQIEPGLVEQAVEQLKTPSTLSTGQP